jgi:peptidoglycan/xylan/chitin deacetylase (PgdA/CDA1 family)
MAKIRILTYHRVATSRTGGTERLTVPPHRFAQQIRLLRLMRTVFCDLDTCAAWLRGDTEDIGRPVVLSFDDGYAELCEHAMPLLVAHAIPAAVYLVADRQHDTWMDWGEQGSLPLMDWARIRELAAAGIIFGSHSLTHPDLTQLGAEKLAAEVGDSKKLIEDRIGLEVRHFCYPYGAHNPRVVDAVENAGYATACVTRRGAVSRDSDPFRLPRLTVGKRMGLLRFGLRLTVRH